MVVVGMILVTLVLLFVVFSTFGRQVGDVGSAGRIGEAGSRGARPVENYMTYSASAPGPVPITTATSAIFQVPTVTKVGWATSRSPFPLTTPVTFQIFRNEIAYRTVSFVASRTSKLPYLLQTFDLYLKRKDPDGVLLCIAGDTRAYHSLSLLPTDNVRIVCTIVGLNVTMDLITTLSWS